MRKLYLLMLEILLGILFGVGFVFFGGGMRILSGIRSLGLRLLRRLMFFEGVLEVLIWICFSMAFAPVLGFVFFQACR